jgi:hypothetical protein
MVPLEAAPSGLAHRRVEKIQPGWPGSDAAAPEGFHHHLGGAAMTVNQPNASEHEKRGGRWVGLVETGVVTTAQRL